MTLFLSSADLSAFAEQMAAHAAKLANRPIIATTLPVGDLRRFVPTGHS